MKFGEKIKKIRTDNNLSQKEFADKIFISRTAVSKWETDNGYPSIETLKVIANTFNISISQLMNNDDIENKKILEDKQAKTFYIFAILAFLLVAIFALMTKLLSNKLFTIGSVVGIVLYMVCAYFAKPKYKRIEQHKNKLGFLLKNIFITLFLIAIFVLSFI